MMTDEGRLLIRRGTMKLNKLSKYDRKQLLK